MGRLRGGKRVDDRGGVGRTDGKTLCRPLFTCDGGLPGRSASPLPKASSAGHTGQRSAGFVQRLCWNVMSLPF